MPAQDGLEPVLRYAALDQDCQGNSHDALSFLSSSPPSPSVCIHISLMSLPLFPLLTRPVGADGRPPKARFSSRFLPDKRMFFFAHCCQMLCWWGEMLDLFKWPVLHEKSPERRRHDTKPTSLNIYILFKLGCRNRKSICCHHSVCLSVINKKHICRKVMEKRCQSNLATDDNYFNINCVWNTCTNSYQYINKIHCLPGDVILGDRLCWNWDWQRLRMALRLLSLPCFMVK